MYNTMIARMTSQVGQESDQYHLSSCGHRALKRSPFQGCWLVIAETEMQGTFAVWISSP